MTKRALPTLVLMLAAAAPAVAQTLAPDTAPRRRLVTVYGEEACPKASGPDEIVVCRRRPAEEQYRLPPIIREEQNIARRDNVAQERAALVDGNLGGAPACSAVGNAGLAGCTEGLNVLGAGRAIWEGLSQGDVPAEEVPQ